MHPSTTPGLRHTNLLRRGLMLGYFTLGWNVVGVVVLAIAALMAGSIALAGFGLDLLIEIGASTIVVWQQQVDAVASGIAAHASARAAATQAGVLDELQIHQIPMLFGGGRRPFEVLPSRVALAVVRVIDTPEATHLRYRVRR